MDIISNTILQYELTSREASAFKCGLIFVHLVKKMFPKQRITDISIGDPRKKELFKYCWKMLNEIEDIIPPEDYKSFIFAQLAIFKSNVDNDIPIFIHPNCLVGEKAMNRWRVFKKAHDKKRNFKESEVDLAAITQVKDQLQKTKSFIDLIAKNKEDIVRSLENGSMLRWVKNKQVCPYYVWLSPTVNNWIEQKQTTMLDYFGLELRPFQKSVNQDTIKIFQELFPSG